MKRPGFNDSDDVEAEYEMLAAAVWMTHVWRNVPFKSATGGRAPFWPQLWMAPSALRKVGGEQSDGLNRSAVRCGALVADLRIGP